MSIFNLASYRFSSRSDVLNETGIYLDSGGLVSTGRGGDSITGTGLIGTDGGFAGGIGGAGIFNSGTLRTEQGNDVIKAQGGMGGAGSGTNSNGGKGGEGIVNNATIATGSEDDFLIGTGGSGGSSTAFGGVVGHGIVNNGIIDMGDGNDLVTGIGGAGGIGPLFTGDGGGGIINYGTIMTGKGNDTITGVGLKGFSNSESGRIDTGSGNDTIDALVGGFSGTGLTSLGNDRDTLKGFGTGRFDGGSGVDTLLIGSPGTYTISALGSDLSGFYTVSNGVTNMYLQNFEFIGNANTGGILAFGPGQQLIVNG